MDFNDGEDVEEEEFEFSRNYFLAKELGGPGKMSGHKLSKIDVVDEQELKATLSNLEPKHEQEIKALMNEYRNQYSQWLFQLRCGFDLLMYGFGSKKALIEDFAATTLTGYSVLVINGYLPAVNLKQVLIALAELLWDEKSNHKTPLKDSTKAQQPFSSHSIEDLLILLSGFDTEEDDSFICIVIDGPGLKDAETQQYLARLAACTNIRMVGSIGHVNAPRLVCQSVIFMQSVENASL